MMNELGVDAVLRLHCNGTDNSAANGIGIEHRAAGHDHHFVVGKEFVKER